MIGEKETYPSRFWIEAYPYGGENETDLTLPYRYEVHWTAKHGGRLISRYRTRGAAEWAVRWHRYAFCVCGCASITDINKETD